MSQAFYDAMNKAERAAEVRHPGYKGPVWGKYTEGSTVAPQPERTQIGFDDGSVYWLDVPAGSVLPGDEVFIMESLKARIVVHVGMSLNGERFDETNRTQLTIPYRTGTFVELHRKVEETWATKA